MFDLNFCRLVYYYNSFFAGNSASRAPDSEMPTPKGSHLSVNVNQEKELDIDEKNKTKKDTESGEDFFIL